MYNKVLLPLWLFFLGLPVMASAAVWGLVVGINDYRHWPDLRGAINDARDIEQALKTIGARNVTLLLNENATRATIKQQWEKLVNQAAAGDTLVFTYAGHGAQENEHVPGSEDDGKDEVLVLSGFRDVRPDSGERLLDNELHHWFKQAAHLNILFVVDACHSGDLTRSIDPRAHILGSRTIGDYLIEEEPLQAPVRPRQTNEHALPHVTFLAAAQENEKTPEIAIEGKPRGALSWAFAQALRGVADSDGNGLLDREELRHYVLSTVEMESEQRQHPRLEPLQGENRSLLPVAEAASTAPAPPLSLRILGLSAAKTTLAGKQLHGISLASEDRLPDLIWDADNQEVLNAHGDTIARLTGAGIEPVQQVIDKWRLLKTVKTLSAPHSLKIVLQPDNGLHRAGAVVSFTLRQHRYPYLTLFNLASNGTVQYLYPIQGDPKTIATDKPFNLLENFLVTPPFGADHLVAIVTATEPLALQRRLRGLNGKPNAAVLKQVLETRDWDDYQMGVLGLYTAPGEKP